MAFAANLSRGDPSDSRARETLRRRHAHDGLYGLALVAGCLVGIGISWQAVLSEGARDRLVAGLFGPAEEAAVRMEVAAPPPAMVAAPAFEAKDRPAALPERLLLDEKTRAAAVPSPQGTAEIVFAVNSSFLVAGDYAELRRFVASLPEQGRLRLAIAASVSDEPLRTGDEAAAGRYNRWLAGRRAERVADWLRSQLGKRAAIATELVPHDPSRRVTVAARAAP